jgi:hypothetical protein
MSTFLCVVLSCVGVEALQWADPLSNEPTKMSVTVSEVNFELEQARGPNLWDIQQQQWGLIHETYTSNILKSCILMASYTILSTVQYYFLQGIPCTSVQILVTSIANRDGYQISVSL